MWTKPSETEAPNARQTPTSNSASAPAISRPNVPTARDLSCLGASLKIKGQITGEENLQVDGKIEGPVSLPGHRLTVGQTGKLNSDVAARELVAYGDITGNLAVRDRVEIKKDASVIGDIKAARISIEDGAHCKGRIEIERGKTASTTEPEEIGVLAGVEAN